MGDAFKMDILCERLSMKPTEYFQIKFTANASQIWKVICFAGDSST